MKNGVEIIGLTDHSVLTQHLTNGSVSNNKIVSMNYNKLTDGPTSFPSLSSTLTIDSDIEIGTYRFMKNGVEVGRFEDNSVDTVHMIDGAITDNKITSMDYNKLTNVPTSFPSKSSTKYDSNIDMDTYLYNLCSNSNK